MIGLAVGGGFPTVFFVLIDNATKRNKVKGLRIV